DNYLPLSDWTTGAGGLDAANWSAPKPSSWPPSTATMNGLGLTGSPLLARKDYLKANIEGGEKFNWFYADSDNAGRGFDPAGTDLQVSLPAGDRLAQSRSPFFAGQQSLANKQIRWWWNNSHQAVYDNGGGIGWSPRGAPTRWIAHSKPITFIEYGFPTIDKATNQPNVSYDPRSSESATPFWSTWDLVAGGGFQPTEDETIAVVAREAIEEYWTSDGNNESIGGVAMIEPTFMCAWNWDARPFPTFPLRSDLWGDAARWPFGNWIDGKGPALPPPAPPTPPEPGSYATFPSLSGRGWSLHQRPAFATGEAKLVSGRSRRTSKMAVPLWTFELTYDLLRRAPQDDLAAIVAFFNARQGMTAPFWFEPSGLSPLAGQRIGVGDDATTSFAFKRTIGVYTESLAAVFDVTAVYRDGTALAPTEYTLDAASFPATMTFATAPAIGAAISADFSYYLLCRFAEDVEDSEEFVEALYRLQSLKLASVKL
ncbi:MAG TPA: glycoside hydrolase TIM-barrel-like domain-containing protein, partial [Beijerinckiaceae bacterium]|nr:glycoside hydrolase TIM-barrel-like domain-containing protein [Beijerinckiaceae bacterium]